MNMNNIMKNLLLGLTVVCVIALIVFCIQLIALNTGDRADRDGATLSGDNGQTEMSNAGDNGENVDSELNGEDVDTELNNEDSLAQHITTPSLPHHGTRREFRATIDTLLAIYVNEQIFRFAGNDMDWAFEYTGEGSATLDIRHMMITPQGVAVDAVTYLNNFMGEPGAEFGSAESIHGSQITGYHVTGQSQSEVYEAWVHTLANTDLALVFIISYNNESQRDELYRTLGSMELVGSELELPGEHADIDINDEDDYYYDPDEDEG